MKYQRSAVSGQWSVASTPPQAAGHYPLTTSHYLLATAPAYTLVELVIVALIVATLAAIALIPAAANDSEQASVAGGRFSELIEYVQSLAVARPDNTFIVKIDAPANRFWPARLPTPDTPLPHPARNAPYVVQLGPASPDGLTGVRITGYDFGGDDVLIFDTSGSMDQDTPASIALTVGTHTVTIRVSPISGGIEVDQSVPPAESAGGGGAVNQGDP